MAGNEVGRRKFRPEEVAMFRVKHRAGLLTTREIQRAMGVSMNTVYRMLNGDTYAGVNEADEGQVAYLMKNRQEQEQEARIGAMRLMLKTGADIMTLVPPPTQEELEELGRQGFGPMAAAPVERTKPQKSMPEMSEAAKERLKKYGFTQNDAGYM